MHCNMSYMLAMCAFKFARCIVFTTRSGHACSMIFQGMRTHTSEATSRSIREDVYQLSYISPRCILDTILNCYLAEFLVNNT